MRSAKCLLRRDFKKDSTLAMQRQSGCFQGEGESVDGALAVLTGIWMALKEAALMSELGPMDSFLSTSSSSLRVKCNDTEQS